jgi:hypothetical protein
MTFEKKLKLVEDAGMIDWLVYNANFSSIAAMSWSKQIIYTKFLNYKILKKLNIFVYKIIVFYVQIKEKN